MAKNKHATTLIQSKRNRFYQARETRIYLLCRWVKVQILLTKTRFSRHIDAWSPCKLLHFKAFHFDKQQLVSETKLNQEWRYLNEFHGPGNMAYSECTREYIPVTILEEQQIPKKFCSIANHSLLLYIFCLHALLRIPWYFR